MSIPVLFRWHKPDGGAPITQEMDLDWLPRTDEYVKVKVGFTTAHCKVVAVVHTFVSDQSFVTIEMVDAKMAQVEATSSSEAPPS